VNTRCVDDEEGETRCGYIECLQPSFVGGSWVQKGFFAAESADPGFSFIYTFLYLDDNDGWQRWVYVLFSTGNGKAFRAEHSEAAKYG
jgi:hypothetical protein